MGRQLIEALIIGPLTAVLLYTTEASASRRKRTSFPSFLLGLFNDLRNKFHILYLYTPRHCYQPTNIKSNYES